MKRLVLITLLCLSAGGAMVGGAAESASAAWHCLATFFGQYKKDGAIGEECKEYGIFPIYEWDLFETNGAKVIATNVLCALVEPEEVSLYNGSNCAPSEAHKGEGEWARALDFEERFKATAAEKLLSTKVSKQVFNTVEGTVECTQATIESGTSSTPEAPWQLAEIQYSNCTAFSFIGATISRADYAFLANGVVGIEKLIRITVSGSSCEISLPAQFTKVGVKYDNSGKNIELLPNVSELHYTASGCTSNGSFTNGTYTGNSEVMIANGTLSFTP